MNFEEIELSDGVRMPFNNIPNNKELAFKNILPVSILYTPLKTIDITKRVDQIPLYCKKDNCNIILNPYCTINNGNKSWTCNLCYNKNNLPSNYTEFLSDGNYLSEMDQENSTIEYKLNENFNKGLIFKNINKKITDHLKIFIVDLSIEEKELEVIKKSLKEGLDYIEDNTTVIIMTYSKNIQIYGLNNNSNNYCLSGDKKYTFEELEKILFPVKKYINYKLSESKDRIIEIIDSLKPNKWNTNSLTRDYRCSGQTILISGCLFSLLKCYGEISFLANGPSTIGNGRISEKNKEMKIRNFIDVEKNNEFKALYNNSSIFYKNMIKKFRDLGVTLDIYSFSLNEIGISEMKNLCEETGGVCFFQEEFTEDEFKTGLIRRLNIDKNKSNVKLKVICSNELNFTGGWGNFSNFEPKNADLNKGEFGHFGSNELYLGTKFENDTIGLCFSYKDTIHIKAKPCYFQLITIYIEDGIYILRVTTISRNFIACKNEILKGIDQEALIGVLSRYIILKGEELEATDINIHLNSFVIKFIRLYSEFQRKNVKSLKIPLNICLIPQFIYYFRKSTFIQRLAISMDEFNFNRMCLNRESLNNILLMIQPSLISYSIDNMEGEAVLCDLKSLDVKCILYIDTYFNKIIWTGLNIHSWISEELHLQEEYSYLLDLINKPKEDLKEFDDERIPCSKFIECHQGSDNERLIKSKLNPSVDENNSSDLSEIYISDDAPLKTFMDYLRKYVVEVP